MNGPIELRRIGRGEAGVHVFGVKGCDVICEAYVCPPGVVAVAALGGQLAAVAHSLHKDGSGSMAWSQLIIAGGERTAAELAALMQALAAVEEAEHA